jgi:hypothetical protein
MELCRETIIDTGDPVREPVPTTHPAAMPVAAGFVLAAQRAMIWKR